ncbi:hypothetical protein [Streptomyces sp. ICC4]|uniref:hypothetical protein n=1 Tax=Streptomyces sp. ICC4 TaxID=2099584 RepID=UPI0013A6E6FE|nr:hypothetical protein [Streptomyces sp. ICC4]
MYAPVALSGITLGFFIESQAGFQAPEEVRARNGTRLGPLRLTPRLVAKLLTASYKHGNSRFAESTAKNPENLGRDPEFPPHNPADAGPHFAATPRPASGSARGLGRGLGRALTGVRRGRGRRRRRGTASAGGGGGPAPRTAPAVGRAPAQARRHGCRRGHRSQTHSPSTRSHDPPPQVFRLEPRVWSQHHPHG